MPNCRSLVMINNNIPNLNSNTEVKHQPIKDMSEMQLASKSLLHVDINHWSLYSVYILEHNTKQCPNQ